MQSGNGEDLRDHDTLSTRMWHRLQW